MPAWDIDGTASAINASSMKRTKWVRIFSFPFTNVRFSASWGPSLKIQDIVSGKGPAEGKLYRVISLLSWLCAVCEPAPGAAPLLPPVPNPLHSRRLRNESSPWPGRSISQGSCRTPLGECSISGKPPDDFPDVWLSPSPLARYCASPLFPIALDPRRRAASPSDQSHARCENP